MPPKRTKRAVIIPTTALPILSGAIAGIAAPAATADAIRAIRQRYAEINAHVSKERKFKRELSGFSVEGGVLVAYLDIEETSRPAPTKFRHLPCPTHGAFQTRLGQPKSAVAGAAANTIQ